MFDAGHAGVWARADWSLVPEPIAPKLRAYIERGEIDDPELLAVLHGARAGKRHARLRAFLWAYAPPAAWGSPTHVLNWMDLGGMEGRNVNC